MHTVPTSLTQMYYVLRTLPTDLRGSGSDIDHRSAYDLQITKSSSSLSLSSTTAYLLRFILLFAFLSHVHTMCCETTKILVTKQSKQLVFEGDFPKLGIGLGVLAVIGAGYGSMYFGMWHQQKKQGYWK